MLEAGLTRKRHDRLRGHLRRQHGAHEGRDRRSGLDARSQVSRLSVPRSLVVGLAGSHQAPCVAKKRHGLLLSQVRRLT
ncbi:MAG: hypothetical protein ACFFAS_02610 [Promethearchaeota archaeon]